MKRDLVIRVLWGAIVVLLAVNLIRPLVSSSITHAAQSIQYKVVLRELRGPWPQRAQAMESLLNAHGKEGWELVVVIAEVFFVFKK